MTINDILVEIKKQKPSREEIINSYNGQVEEDYVDYILNTFEVKYNSEEDSYSNLIDSLINSTNINQVDFGGVTFSTKIEDFVIENDTPFLQFASFQENILALDSQYNHFYYIDLYDPNNNPIIIKSPFDEGKFISSLLYLLKLDVDFKYRNVAISKKEVDILTNIAGEKEYAHFFRIVLSQYE